MSGLPVDTLGGKMEDETMISPFDVDAVPAAVRKSLQMTRVGVEQKMSLDEARPKFVFGKMGRRERRC